MKTIAVLNQKGGVGKTTITTNLSHALALNGYGVTALDLDPQGHLTASLGIFKPPAHGLADVLLGERALDSVRVDTRESLHLIPAGNRLREIEESSGNVKQQMFLLKNAIDESDLQYDYLMIDCPPSSGLLAANAILAIDEILVPVSGDYLSLNGLAHLMITLKRFDALREKPITKRIVLSRFVARRRLSGEVLDKLKQHFPGMILNTSVREAAALAECPGVGRTIFEYRSSSASADDFRQLAIDLVEGNTLT
ncbi:MAG: ParA family protein [Chromatiales bacterium]|jgi:chromosome partitioning protein